MINSGVYSWWRYKFGSKDLPFFLGITNKNGQQSNGIEGNKIKIGSENVVDRINLEEIDDYLNESADFVQTQRKRSRRDSFDSKVNLEEDEDEFLDHKKEVKLLSNEDIVNLSYRLKNKTKTCAIKEVEGKLECPICRLSVKNVHLHFSRKADCGDKIDMDHFSNIFETYKKNVKKIKDNGKTLRYKTKLK